MCKERYRLTSRYKNTDTTLKRVDDTHYLATTTGMYTRVIYENDTKDIRAIDFEGGPMIYKNHDILDAMELGTVKDIKSVEGGYILEF